VTNPWGDPNQGWNSGPVDYFDNNAASGHRLIVKIQDAPEYFRTQNNPDGMVHPTRGATWAPFPNTVVRGWVVDLDVAAADGSRGKLYEGAVIFPSSLVRTMKRWVSDEHPKLLMWRKTGPKQTDPYELFNMAGDAEAVAIADEYLARNPQVLGTPAPEAYNGQPPAPQQYQQGPPGYGAPAGQYPPQGYQGQGYGPQQGYGQPQPGWNQPPAPPQQGGWNPPPPDPWNQPRPQQGPPPQQGWGADQGYNQHPPRQAQPGNFLEAYNQGGYNHHGQPQASEPPY